MGVKDLPGLLPGDFTYRTERSRLEEFSLPIRRILIHPPASEAPILFFVYHDSTNNHLDDAVFLHAKWYLQPRNIAVN
jgi:hypothetical protein